MALMVVAHPDPTFTGRVAVEDVGLVFVGGFTGPTDVPTEVQAQLTAEGFTLNATPGANYGGRYILDTDLEDDDSEAMVILRAASVVAAAEDIDDTGTALGAAAVAAFAPRPGTTTKTRVLIIGSSNAAGTGASSTANSWAGRLATALSATHDFFNEAVSGISPAYWVTPDGTTGRSPLEDLILEHRPHIVIASYTAQNAPGGPGTAFVGYVDQTINTCDRYGVRMVGITPYNSESYTSAQRDINAWIGRTLKTRGVWLLNWSSIWGTAATIPDSIDSGDGLHINDAGHLEQYRQIPADYLSLGSVLGRPVRFEGLTPGLLVPSGSAASPLSTSGFPAGSWTVGFRVTLPAVNLAPVVLLSFLGSNGTTRLRVINNPAQINVAGNIVHPDQAGWTDGSDHHVTLTYNAVTLESVLYIDGAAVSTVTATAGSTFTGLILGAHPSHSFYAVGYKFRELSVHATVLTPADVAKLSSRLVPTASLYLATALDDAPTRPAGALLATQFGDATSPTLGLATA